MSLWLTEDRVVEQKGKENCHRVFWNRICDAASQLVAVTPMLLVSTDSTVCTKTVLCAYET